MHAWFQVLRPGDVLLMELMHRDRVAFAFQAEAPMSQNQVRETGVTDWVAGTRTATVTYGDVSKTFHVRLAGQRRDDMATTRARDERIEFRTTPETRRLVERAVAASETNLTDFAESSLVLAAQRVMADREDFVLSERAAAEWETINSRPARGLPGLRELIARTSPFDE